MDMDMDTYMCYRVNNKLLFVTHLFLATKTKGNHISLSQCLLQRSRIAFVFIVKNAVPDTVQREENSRGYVMLSVKLVCAVCVICICVNL